MKSCNGDIADLVVLYADDDENDRALFGLSAERMNLGLWLYTVPDGKEAIDFLEGKGSFSNPVLFRTPDLIVLDLKMSGVNGFEFLEWRNSHPGFLKVPVAVFTGSLHQPDVQKAKQLGANEVFLKPVGFREWQETVRQIHDYGLEKLLN